MLPGAVGHKVGVVGWCWVGYRPTRQGIQYWQKMMQLKPGAAGVEVAQIVGKNLQLVSAEVAVVPQDMVMAGS